jgi:hypothetical protein
VTGAEPAARAWSEHLRHGGATAWSEWVRTGAVAEPPAGWQVPGAAQLEVVRRLASTGRLGGASFSALADVTLSRSGPGRGLAQLPLALPGAVPPAYGAPPVDPAEVPTHELLRVAVGVLVELALAAPAGPRPGGASGRRLARLLRASSARGPEFHLAGAPVTTSVVRADLQAAGHREHGASPTVVLVGRPFDRLLGEVWSARVQRGAAVRWPGFVRRWSGRPLLPPSADLAALAEHWAGRVGAERVHVVVPGPDVRAVEVVAGVLGLEPPRGGRVAPVPRWAPLPPAAVDVVRRANAVLGVRVDPARHREVLQPLLRGVAAARPSTVAVTVPGPYGEWARSRAERLRETLSGGGYRVHGDLRALAPVLDGPTRPDVDEALRVALDACLGLAPTREEEDRQ